MEFDHVALATDNAGAALEVLSRRLGATVISGGTPGPFRAMQLRMGDAGDGMTVELLEPGEGSPGEFLRRFLQKHGEGPHHLTFKTDNIERELDRFRELGHHPVGVQLESDFWREFFIHPGEGPGTVIQVAQLVVPDPPMEHRMTALAPWSNPWWPEVERGPDRHILDRVIMGSPEPDATVDYLSRVLGGSVLEDRVVAWGRDRVQVVTAEKEGIERLAVQGLAEPTVVAGTTLVPL